MKRKWLAVHPLVHVEHGELVGAGVGGIVAVVGKVQAVVAVGFEVGSTVEEIILRVRGLRLRLHLALSQTAVDTEGECLRCHVVVRIGDGTLFRREQGLAITKTAGYRISVGLCLRLRGVLQQILLVERIAVDFAPVAVIHRKLVALVQRLRSGRQLVGGVIGEALRECLVLQPRVGGGYLGHVADHYPFDNMFFQFSHFNRWSKYWGVLYNSIFSQESVIESATSFAIKSVVNKYSPLYFFETNFIACSYEHLH